MNDNPPSRPIKIKYTSNPTTINWKTEEVEEDTESIDSIAIDSAFTSGRLTRTEYLYLLQHLYTK